MPLIKLICWLAVLFSWILSVGQIPSTSASGSMEPISGVAPAPALRYKSCVELTEGGALKWTGDLRDALSRAANRGKLVFVAFGGATNLNSTVNEARLSEPIIKKALEPYVLVALYVDIVPKRLVMNEPSTEKCRAEGLANYDFQIKLFDTHQVPLYVILRPTGSHKFVAMDIYRKTRIQNPKEFAQFLDAAAKKEKK